MTKSIFLAYVPFTGLGLYGGFRGNRWLRNRIKVFKQFVVPSLLNQTDKDFVLWIQWRKEERNNKYVNELDKDLTLYFDSIGGKRKHIFTYGGLCFWDDKFEDKAAWDKLAGNLHNNMPELFDVLGGYDEVIMLIQPSDDLYEADAIRRMKDAFAADKSLQCVGYQQGFHCNYVTGDIKHYNPTTNPPFFAIRFPKDTFTDPIAHMRYTGPYRSHEYAPSHMKYWRLPGRGFMVGSHGENISTHANHPFIGHATHDRNETARVFGIAEAGKFELPKSLRRDLMRKLPHNWQKKLRFVFGERVYNRIYQFIRN